MTLPPGPRGPLALTTIKWMYAPLAFLDDAAKRYGDPFTMRLPGMPPLVIFSSPDAVKEVFTDDGAGMHAGKANLPLKPFVGERSVLLLDGAEHMRHRRLLLPPFHGERMQAYATEMIALTNAAIDRLPLEEPFAIHPHFQAITLRVIVRTIFGVDEGPRYERFCDVLAKVTDLASWPWLLLPSMQKDLGPWSPWGRVMRYSAEVEKMLYEEIHERRRRGTAGRVDVLSMLVDARDESGAPMTDEELRDELVTLLLAGHETTATALAWAMRWILDRRDVKARLDDEIAHARDTGGLTAERIGKLEYLDAVVREALRLQPVVPFVGRVLQRPMTLAGFDLPKGSVAVCAIYLAQRRPDVYPNPTRFDPDRFLGRKFTPYELFPFGGGIRRCIGMAFALYEMKMVLATVLARTQMRLERGRRVKVVRRAITLTPSHGLRVVMDARRARETRDTNGDASRRSGSDKNTGASTQKFGPALVD
jgi:cytochrome P450